MRAQLLPLDGSSAIEIGKDLLVVGRHEDCDLRLEHKSVSKIHCVIIKTDGLLMLRNLGSTNGTRSQRHARPPGRPAAQRSTQHRWLQVPHLSRPRRPDPQGAVSPYFG